MQGEAYYIVAYKVAVAANIFLCSVIKIAICSLDVFSKLRF